MDGSQRILDYFFTGKVMCIPVYQRNYDWKIENCKQLFDDLVELSGYPGKKHFFGSVIYQIDTHTEDRIIIDGQQRLTTIALLLTAIRDAIRSQSVATVNGSLGEEITDRLIWRYKGNLTLCPVDNDADAYERLIRKGEITEGSNVCANYWFNGELSGLDA